MCVCVCVRVCVCVCVCVCALFGQVKKLEKRYEAIPEEYYKHTGHRLRWHAWEICSGSGRLSLIMIMAGLLIGFPVDLRYGWDINGVGHRNRRGRSSIQSSSDCAMVGIREHQAGREQRV